MDIETSRAIESLRDDIGKVEAALLAEIGKGRADMATKDDLRHEIGAVRAEMVTKYDLRQEIGTMRGEIGTVRGEMASMREELMRHTDVRFESLRDDVRLIADGFA